MSVLVRITDFVPSTLIRSQEADDELNQLVNLLSGVSTTKDTLLKFSDGTNPVLRVDQLGAGKIQQWLQNGSEKANITNAGALTSVGVVSTGQITTSFNNAANPALDVNQIGAGLIQRWQNNGTDRATLSALGKLLLPAGVGSTPSTDQISNLGTYFVNPAGGTTGANTTETDFSSKTTAANTFPVDGDFLLWFSQVQFAANANNKRYRVYFAGNALFDTGAQPYNGQNMTLIGLIMRRATSFISGSFAAIFTANINNVAQFNQFTPITFTGTNILKSTGQNGTASALDIVETVVVLVKGCI